MLLLLLRVNWRFMQREYEGSDCLRIDEWRVERKFIENVRVVIARFYAERLVLRMNELDQCYI